MLPKSTLLSGFLRRAVLECVAAAAAAPPAYPQGNTVLLWFWSVCGSLPINVFKRQWGLGIIGSNL